MASGIAALLRILFRLGLLDRERGEFWRFFGHTMIEHLWKIAEAVKLAAMGDHFRKLTDAFGE